MQNLHAIIRLHCPDSKGIVVAVTNFIFSHGGNILSSRQYHEELDDRFFLRARVDFSEYVEIDPDAIRQSFAEVAEPFGMSYDISFSHERPRMAIFVSKYDHCLYDLFLRQQYGELKADIAVVISNHEDVRDVVEHFGAPFFHVPMRDKVAGEAEQLRLCHEYQVDFIVLARYMQILTPTLLGEYPNAVINVHHGFLPAFKGAKPYHQAYEHGVKIVGATSHYATADLDMGPIIEQEVIRVGHTHTIEDMISLGRDVEKQVLAKAVRAHIEDRIITYKNRTVVFD